MKTPRFILTAFVAVLLTAASAFAADPTGSWKWSSAGRNGQTRETTAKFELKDGKLTGSVAGRGGDIPITNATFKDDMIAFSTVMNFGGNSVEIKYSGKLENDTITGTVERPGMNGGEARKTEWKATKAK
jgi:hypothetical protein